MTFTPHTAVVASLDGGTADLAQLGEAVARPTETATVGAPTTAGNNEPGRAEPLKGHARPALEVVGVDLSLTRTGLAGLDEAIYLTPPRKLVGFPRLRWIRREVCHYTAAADLVVIEGLSYGSHTPSALERAGLWHLVVDAIDLTGTRWVTVTPATVKKYATGKGNADKDQVLAAAIRRLNADIDNNNCADAAWLAAIGHDLLDQPIVTMPAAHRVALDVLRPQLSATPTIDTGR